MKRIKYNLAIQKQIDAPSLWIKGLLLITISLALILTGTYLVTGIEKKHKEEVNKLELYKKKVEEIRESSKEYSEFIDKAKALWGQRVKFANNLIQRKSFSNIKRLDILENSMPDGVWVEKISLGYGSKSVLVLEVGSYTHGGLFEFYKKMSDFNPVIQSEGESRGQFHAQVKVKMEL